MKNRGSIAFGFLALIFVGAILLSSPWARNAGAWGNFEDALFTACSAVCVTGLSVVNVAGEYTFTGQCVLLTLVEIGCLGLMTFGTFLLVAVGRRLSLNREFSLMNAYGAEGVRGLRGLVCWLIGSMVTVEALGAVVLAWRLDDWYRGVFYSVMAFCNAGFSLRTDSIGGFAGDPWTVLTMALETILGGIGFLVIYNVATFGFRRRGTGRRRLSLHSSVVLRFTFYLLAATFAVFLLAEWNGALEPYAPVQKLWVGFFQAVTPRTCGFVVVPTEALQPVTRLVYEAMMFVGGAPGSAAAGIKVTTLAVICYTILAMCRGENETVISRRMVSQDVIRESVVIVFVMLTAIVLTVGALSVTETATALPHENLVFEAISAVTTTGLSVGDTTARLSTAGRVVIMLAMFFGRLGALTVVLMIGDRESTRQIRYPSEELMVG